MLLGALKAGRRLSNPNDDDDDDGPDHHEININVGTFDEDQTTTTFMIVFPVVIVLFLVTQTCKPLRNRVKPSAANKQHAMSQLREEEEAMEAGKAPKKKAGRATSGTQTSMNGGQPVLPPAILPPPLQPAERRRESVASVAARMSLEKEKLLSGKLEAQVTELDQKKRDSAEAWLTLTHSLEILAYFSQSFHIVIGLKVPWPKEPFETIARLVPTT